MRVGPTSRSCVPPTPPQPPCTRRMSPPNRSNCSNRQQPTLPTTSEHPPSPSCPIKAEGGRRGGPQRTSKKDPGVTASAQGPPRPDQKKGPHKARGSVAGVRWSPLTPAAACHRVPRTGGPSPRPPSWTPLRSTAAPAVASPSGPWAWLLCCRRHRGGTAAPPAPPPPRPRAARDGGMPNASRPPTAVRGSGGSGGRETAQNWRQPQRPGGRCEWGGRGSGWHPHPVRRSRRSGIRGRGWQPGLLCLMPRPPPP